jgi:hypothetical protein
MPFWHPSEWPLPLQHQRLSEASTGAACMPATSSGMHGRPDSFQGMVQVTRRRMVASAKAVSIGSIAQRGIMCIQGRSRRNGPAMMAVAVHSDRAQRNRHLSESPTFSRPGYRFDSAVLGHDVFAIVAQIRNPNIFKLDLINIPAVFLSGLPDSLDSFIFIHFDNPAATITDKIHQVAHKVMESAERFKVMVRLRVERAIVPMMYVEIRGFGTTLAAEVAVPVPLDDGLEFTTIP